MDGSGMPNRRLFVSNLNYNTTWQQLKDHFKQIGPVVYSTVLKVRQAGGGVGCCRLSGTAGGPRAQWGKLALSSVHAGLPFGGWLGTGLL